MRSILLLLTLAACGATPHDSDGDVVTTCDDAVDVDACWDGCTTAQATAAHNWGRLACLHGDELADIADPTDQGHGRDYQLGYDACFWVEVEEGWASEGCGR